MRRSHHVIEPVAVVTALLAVCLGLSACSGPAGTPTTGGDDFDSAETGSPGRQADSTDDDGPIVGVDCADVEQSLDSDGFQSLAALPTSTALTRFPQLSRLVDAVSGGLNPDVDLVDALDGAELTLFAPIDDAFASLDDATVDALGSDSDSLTRVLEYHVVTERLVAKRVSGILPTLEGGELEVSGYDDVLTVEGASLVCGGISTANAELYLIGGVLAPEE